MCYTPVNNLYREDKREDNLGSPTLLGYEVGGQYYWKVLLMSSELGFGVWGLGVDITSSHSMNCSGFPHWGGGKVQGDQGVGVNEVEQASVNEPLQPAAHRIKRLLTLPSSQSSQNRLMRSVFFSLLRDTEAGQRTSTERFPSLQCPCPHHAGQSVRGSRAEG